MLNLSWVPLPVLQKALTEKQHREISLFLYLKMTTSSRVRIKGRKKKELLQVFSISESTLYSRIKTLNEWDWMGYDGRTKVHYVRGFKRIYEIERFISKTVVRLYSKDLFKLQVFSFSASVGYLLRSQSRRKGRGAEQKTWRSNQSPASVFKPVAISVMETLFSLSKDTIVDLKKQAIKDGYLQRRRGYKHLYHISKHSYEIYRLSPGLWGLLRRDGFMLSILLPDEFTDNLFYKRKIYR